MRCPRDPGDDDDDSQAAGASRRVERSRFLSFSVSSFSLKRERGRERETVSQVVSSGCGSTACRSPRRWTSSRVARSSSTAGAHPREKNDPFSFLSRRRLEAWCRAGSRTFRSRSCTRSSSRASAWRSPSRWPRPRPLSAPSLGRRPTRPDVGFYVRCLRVCRRRVSGLRSRVFWKKPA